MSLQTVEARTQGADDLQQPQVVSGERLRRLVGLGNRRFYALVASGRLSHLRAINLCTTTRTYYVRSAALAWFTEQPQLTLRASQSRRSR
jgi:hypothetical protein